MSQNEQIAVFVVVAIVAYRLGMINAAKATAAAAKAPVDTTPLDPYSFLGWA